MAGSRFSFKEEELLRESQRCFMSACRSWPRCEASSPDAGVSSAAASRRQRTKARKGQAAWSAGTRGPPRAAAHRPPCERGRPGILDGGDALVPEHFIPVAGKDRNGRCRFWNIQDQRARRDIPVFFLFEVRENHFVRGAAPALREAPVERERALRARLGNAGLLLQRHREERIGRGAQRPLLIGEAA